MNPVTFSPCIDIATISVMQRSMNRVLMTRAIRLRSRMRGKLSCPVLEAGRREQSLLPSYHIRYIEHHQLPDIKGPVYVISILENFSRMLLASAISERQDTAAYLRVLASALRNYGAPEAIVTDSGGVFYSKRAMAIYEALDIRKERIDPRQSWQNYIEAHFGIMWRLADYYLNKASTLDEMKKAHRKFIRDYNCQIHFAHRERQDGRHSPQDVLRGVLARTLPAPTLARIFFATEFTRHLDRSGYIRFRRWRISAEKGRGLATSSSELLHQHAAAI